LIISETVEKGSAIEWFFIKLFDYSQRVLIPVSLEEQLVSGTLEFAIHTLVENRMDLSVFDSNYQNDETGRRAYDPKILLKVVLLAYSRGVTSSRQIERACCEGEDVCQL